jgi:stress-induced morphogen
MKPEQMKERLETAYPGAVIEVIDLTGTHDHYEVYVESPVFAGLSRIQQHQHVMSVFGPELKTGEVHALSIKTKTKESK